MTTPPPIITVDAIIKAAGYSFARTCIDLINLLNTDMSKVPSSRVSAFAKTLIIYSPNRELPRVTLPRTRPLCGGQNKSRCLARVNRGGFCTDSTCIPDQVGG